MELEIESLRQKLKDAKIQVEEITKENKEFSNELNKFMENIVPLSNLFNNGMGNLIFTKVASSKSNHTSDHQEIKLEVTKNFKILNDIDNYIKIDKLKFLPSSFLIECKKEKNYVDFPSEITIQHLVKLYFSDILSGSKLKLKSAFEGSVGSVDDNSENKKHKTSIPDLWIVIDDDYRPILAIEIKSPRNTNSSTRTDSHINSNANVTGQLYDYMIKQKSFYNQKFIFGILTSLDEWKICWLSNTNEAAISDFLLDNNIEMEEENDNNERKMYSTRIYKHNEKNLAKIILSVIVKAYKSPKNPVDLISLERTYVLLSKDTWMWNKFNEKEYKKIKKSVTLQLPRKNTSTFKVLRYFHGGDYSRIRLGMSNNGNIVVIKNFMDDTPKNIPEQELKCWKEINGIEKAYLTIISKSKNLVIPLVFHIHINHNLKKIYIPLDLKLWSVQDKAIPGKLPKTLRKINKQLLKYKLNKLREIAEDAIEKCARMKYIHDDLEFRHISVCPIFDDDEKLIKLEPMFIDFGMMKEASSYSKAKKKMMKRLDYLFDHYDKNEYTYV